MEDDMDDFPPTAIISASRLMLLWEIESIIEDPDTSDDDKFDTVFERLREHSSLLVALNEDEAVIKAMEE
jgi:hypothetical protein